MPPETKLQTVTYYRGCLDGHREVCQFELPFEVLIPVSSRWCHLYRLAWQDTEKGAGYKFWRRGTAAEPVRDGRCDRDAE